MALPTINKSWRIAHLQIGGTGVAINDYKSFWLALKNAFTNGPGFTGAWKDTSGSAAADPTSCVVLQSSNSVTASAADNISTLAHIVGSAANVAHTWMVLSFPGIGANSQLCIDIGDQTGGFNYLDESSAPDGGDPTTTCGGFIFSHSAGFAASTLTAKRPRGNSSQQDETQLWQRRDKYNAWGEILAALSNSVSWTAQMHVMRSSDGACNRVVVYYAGLPIFFLILDVPANPFTTVTPHTWNVDDVPWLGAVFSSQLTSVNALSMNASSPGPAWLTDTPIYTRMCSSVNPTVRTVQALRLSCEAYNGASALASAINYYSELDGSSYPMLPIGLVCTVTGYRGRAGVLQDIWNVPPILAEGDSFPNDGSKQFIVFGDFAFPWDRTIPALV